MRVILQSKFIHNYLQAVNDYQCFGVKKTKRDVLRFLCRGCRKCREKNKLQRFFAARFMQTMCGFAYLCISIKCAASDSGWLTSKVSIFLFTLTMSLSLTIFSHFDLFIYLPIIFLIAAFNARCHGNCFDL